MSQQLRYGHRTPWQWHTKTGFSDGRSACLTCPGSHDYPYEFCQPCRPPPQTVLILLSCRAPSSHMFLFACMWSFSFATRNLFRQCSARDWSIGLPSSWHVTPSSCRYVGALGGDGWGEEGALRFCERCVGVGVK